MSSVTAYEGWAIVELFGHVRLAGKVCEVDQFGTKMLRIDVPELDGRPAFTTFKGGGALYAVTPTVEEVALAVIRAERPAPPIPYDLQRRAIAPIQDAERTAVAGAVDQEDDPPDDDMAENGAKDEEGPGF